MTVDMMTIATLAVFGVLAGLPTVLLVLASNRQAPPTTPRPARKSVKSFSGGTNDHEVRR